MKRLLLNWVADIGKATIMALMLSVAAIAAPVVSTPAGSTGSDFNHMTTGFPLLGGHATAACETCHVGGVFKGTPKNCDGCHALGKRVVATPKSSSHIVTDAPCESCHFNTSTWLGARYNHGTAQPGQCRNCHNGRVASGKPASHNSNVNQATQPCDSCHRSSAWFPASWNHTVAGSCDQAGCHLLGSNQYYRGSGPSHTRTGSLTYACTDCHNNYFDWKPAHYKHNTGAPCSSCHNGTVAVGKPGGHVATTDECNQCHTTTISWSPALGAKPANHIPYNTVAQCSSCHVGGGVVTGAALHAYVSTYACTTCHLKNNTYAVWGQETKSLGHEGWSTGDCSQSGCHRPAGNRGTSYINWD